VWSPTELEIERVFGIAASGAQSVCHGMQMVQDAAQLAVEAWQEAGMRGRLLAVGDADAWAWSVGKKMARLLLREAEKAAAALGEPMILEVVAADAPDAGSLEHGEDQKTVFRRMMLRVLGRRDRDVYRSHFVAGKNLRETAEELHIGVHAVRRSIDRIVAAASALPLVTPSGVLACPAEENPGNPRKRPRAGSPGDLRGRGSDVESP
jgi:DNA-directed RNA polymerase specialized sigma24 family protein